MCGWSLVDHDFYYQYLGRNSQYAEEEPHHQLIETCPVLRYRYYYGSRSMIEQISDYGTQEDKTRQDKTIHLSLTTNMINIILSQHLLYPFTATGEADRGREARTAFLALLRLEAAFINIRAFARARQKPNKRQACCLGLGRTQGLNTGRGVLAVADAMSVGLSRLCQHKKSIMTHPKHISIKA